MPYPIVRFAPSPTGRIHIGNARTALLNFLFTKKNHGEFILRFDDTDVERSKEEYAQAIEVDLAWLGIVPDAVLRQSERFALYHAAAGKLREAGRLYPCFETAEELDRKRKRQQARGLPPVYDRPRSPFRVRSGPSWKPGAAGHTGASNSTTKSCAGPISCAARAISIAPRYPIRCSCGKTARTSIPCHPWSMTSPRKSRISSGARIM